jgi:hypothetical protein
VSTVPIFRIDFGILTLLNKMCRRRYIPFLYFGLFLPFVMLDRTIREWLLPHPHHIHDVGGTATAQPHQLPIRSRRLEIDAYFDHHIADGWQTCVCRIRHDGRWRVHRPTPSLERLTTRPTPHEPSWGNRAPTGLDHAILLCAIVLAIDLLKWRLWPARQRVHHE